MINYDEDTSYECLPELSDYKEVKTFEDYELSQCIIYELAIRNPRYKEEVAYVMSFYSKNKTDIDYAIKTEASNIPKEKMGRYGLLIEIQRYISNIETIPFDVHGTEVSYKDIKTYGEDFYQLLDTIIKYNLKKHNNKKRKITKLIDEIDINVQEGFQVTTTIHTINQAIFHIPEKNAHNSKSCIQDPKNTLPILKRYIDHETSTITRKRLNSKKVLISEINVQNNFKRPKLRINNHRTKAITAEIDLSLPEGEIYAYIKKIKDYLNNNVQIQTPMQSIEPLLYTHEDIKHEKNLVKEQKKAHLFANKLFVYDYITALVKDNQEYNTSCKVDLEETIKSIEEAELMSYDLDKTQKIKQAKNIFLQNTLSTSPRKLIKDKDIQKYLGQTEGTLRNYYDDISSLLKDERFRSLAIDIY